MHDNFSVNYLNSSHLKTHSEAMILSLMRRLLHNVHVIRVHSVQNLLSSSLLPKNLKIKIYRTITLLVVLYGRETWSLTLREKRRLRVSGNRVMKGIFGPERDEVTREWRKPHNVELSDLYPWPNIFWVIKSRRMRWSGNIARMGERRGVYRILVAKNEGNRILRRPRRRKEDNIKMDLQEVGYGAWIASI